MDVNELLKKNGYSYTKPRREVFSLLEVADRPMGMNEIIKQCPTIDRATAYRTIALFEELEIVKRVWFGFKSKVELSEDFESHHHHLVCEQCGRVEKIDSNSLERSISRLTTKTGYTPTKHHVEIFGYCKECQPNNDEDAEV